MDFLGSFNVAYRKAAFEAVGGFDASFPCASGEDNDLAYRLQDVGGRLRFTREAVVAHHHPTRLWPYLRTQARHGYWRMKLYAKHIGRARRGDQYAGMADLAAPPLALLVVALLAGVPDGRAQLRGLGLEFLDLLLELAVARAAHGRASGHGRSLPYAPSSLARRSRPLLMSSVPVAKLMRTILSAPMATPGTSATWAVSRQACAKLSEPSTRTSPIFRP